MSNIIEQTTLNLKKKIERISGRYPSKVRFTGATNISLRKNINNNLLEKAFAKYNNTYNELRNAVVTKETEKAEQEARDNALEDEKIEKERNAKIAEDNLIARISSAEVAKPRIDFLNIEILKLNGRIGTIGNNYGINVKNSFSTNKPKALSVPIIYSKSYKEIMKNSNAGLYELKEVLEEDGNNNELPVVEEKKVANWKNLFDNIETNTKEEITVALDSAVDKDEEEYIPIVTKGVSEEELSQRKLIGELGDELQEVRRLQESTNGLASPFSEGLYERENSLLDMLSNISGVERIIKNKNNKSTRNINNTEFQNLVEQIVGYKEPISKEEHDSKEREMQLYYSDPEVSETIDNLRHKDLLFSFNQPEAYNKVMEAERKDNERLAIASTTFEPINVNNEIESKETESKYNQMIFEGAIEQARMLQKENELIDLVNGAEEQAQMLKHQNDLIDIEEKNMQEQIIKQAAEEQARMLQKGNELIDLVNGAEEQAQMLKHQNDLIDIEEKNRQEQIIKQAAEEQAKMLQKENELIDLVNGAEEQAQMLKHQNDLIDIEEKNRQEQVIKQAAEEQARMLQKENELIDLVNGAEEQAQMLNNVPKEVDNMEQLAAQIVYNNTTDDYVIEGAKEQAAMLKEQNEKAESLIFANEHSKITETLNIQLDEIKKAAEEQAQRLQANNEYIEILDSAKKEAKNIMKNNIRIDLINGAEVQARMLYENDKKRNSGLQSIFENNNSIIIDNNDRYASIVRPSKGIMLRSYQMDNMNKRLQEKRTNNNRKELLMNLKEQLNSNDFDFLRYNENTIRPAKMPS